MNIQFSLRSFLLLLILLVIIQRTFCQQIFEPHVITPQVIAKKANSKIVIDGKLAEPDWQSASIVKSFKEVEPYQGTDAKHDTEVKILFDENNIYFGVFARDSTEIKDVRSPNLTRDFAFDNTDLFGIAIDAFNTKRNAVAFQVTPYGAQRDLQSFDDAIFDKDWDALWYSKTLITDSGWYAEISIPFHSIRYPKQIDDKEVVWGINFVRIHRSSNEIAAFPGFPRSFDTYRMTYVAHLTGLYLPRPSMNIRLNPYILQGANRFKEKLQNATDQNTKIGGDIKWAISQNAVLDATFNTDFAQADVDRQVINLTRFSVYFPERRQFFLENSGLFLTGDNENIEPFFSRRIGLDVNGNPIPLIAGAKYTDRTSKRSIGAIYALQQGNDTLDNINFGAFRYLHNYGNASNAGVMITSKLITSNSKNFVAALSGVHRIGEKWMVKYLMSGSYDEMNASISKGMGSNFNMEYISNDLYINSNHSLISENYSPGIGFISRNNLLAHNSIIIPILRPSWKPKFIRSIQPGMQLNVAQSASDLKMQEGALSLFPLYLIFNNGSLLSFRYQYNWQMLAGNFKLLSAVINKGDYYFNRYRIKYNSDLSKKVSFSSTAETGAYFNGKLNTFNGEILLSPIPHVSFIGSYEFNKVIDLGVDKIKFNTQLYTATLRLALNPNMQLTSFYQYNSTYKIDRLNIRFSWQYKPLSFIYLIFNSNNNGLLDTQERNGIFKVNFLKQLK